uniref:Uncharacterized protein n=1 Tax=Chromera velia CCMP2878 TaxID=1169474 RepID=A0A0G4HKN2_9ALVE|eukprot:Cvel_28569.t1-p1 / transcript=Cvel_28569.t1 / gene=Cvel_28569 / organism=Chromera_velia_CCMP2878 / gene_product=hypothetical protein / transcript_product=hypothetical protein / location=Cvel_scaffold3762:7216-10487(+) / protein_length=884 / sequence_SO=supercontig / SO=protein_coding / is_pseudo=false
MRPSTLQGRQTAGRREREKEKENLQHRPPPSLRNATPFSEKRLPLETRLSSSHSSKDPSRSIPPKPCQTSERDQEKERMQMEKRGREEREASLFHSHPETAERRSDRDETAKAEKRKRALPIPPAFSQPEEEEDEVSPLTSSCTVLQPLPIAVSHNANPKVAQPPEVPPAVFGQHSMGPHPPPPQRSHSGSLAIERALFSDSPESLRRPQSQPVQTSAFGDRASTSTSFPERMRKLLQSKVPRTGPPPQRPKPLQHSTAPPPPHKQQPPSSPPSPLLMPPPSPIRVGQRQAEGGGPSLFRSTEATPVFARDKQHPISTTRTPHPSSSVRVQRDSPLPLSVDVYRQNPSHQTGERGKRGSERDMDVVSSVASRLSGALSVGLFRRRTEQEDSQGSPPPKRRCGVETPRTTGGALCASPPNSQTHGVSAAVDPRGLRTLIDRPRQRPPDAQGGAAMVCPATTMTTKQPARDPLGLKHLMNRSLQKASEGQKEKEKERRSKLQQPPSWAAHASSEGGSESVCHKSGVKWLTSLGETLKSRSDHVTEGSHRQGGGGVGSYSSSALLRGKAVSGGLLSRFQRCVDERGGSARLREHRWRQAEQEGDGDPEKRVFVHHVGEERESSDRKSCSTGLGGYRGVAVSREGLRRLPPLVRGMSLWEFSDVEVERVGVYSAGFDPSSSSPSPSFCVFRGRLKRLDFPKEAGRGYEKKGSGQVEAEGERGKERDGGGEKDWQAVRLLLSDSSALNFLSTLGRHAISAPSVVRLPPSWRHDPETAHQGRGIGREGGRGGEQSGLGVLALAGSVQRGEGTWRDVTFLIADCKRVGFDGEASIGRPSAPAASLLVRSDSSREARGIQSGRTACTGAGHDQSSPLFVAGFAVPLVATGEE